jgi:protein TonB
MPAFRRSFDLRFFLAASLIIHLTVVYMFYSSEKISLSPPSEVEVAVIEQTADTAPTDLESENIIPSPYEKVQRPVIENTPAETSKPPSPSVSPSPPAVAVKVKAAAIAAVPPAPGVAAPVQSVASSDIGLKAKYPRLSRMLAEEGRVIVLVHTNERGFVKKMSVAASSGFSRLDEAALDAVSNSRAVSYDKNSRIKISFLFKLK